MNEILDALCAFDALRDGDVVHQRTQPEIAPTYTDMPAFEGNARKIGEAVLRRGVSRLYQHQTDAIMQARAGSNVVLQAPTASGKTLAFQIPMLQSLRKRGQHALMIYPNKALALDQREQLDRLTRHLGEPITLTRSGYEKRPTRRWLRRA